MQLSIQGGIFHGDDDVSQIAFKYAIERINSRSPQYMLIPMMFNISRTDSFKAQQIGKKAFTLFSFDLNFLSTFLVCHLASEGVDVIFGPNSVETSGIVSSLAERFEIPHVIFHWKTKPLRSDETADDTMTLNLYPDSDFLAEAFANVLVDYSWKSYTVIYENKENLIRLKDVLQIHDPKSMPISVRQLDDNYGSLLKEINARGDFNIILDITAEKIVPFLKEAANVKMLGDYNNYFITNLDAHTLNLGAIPGITSNITSLRIVDPNSLELTNALTVWRQKLSDFDMEARQVPHEAGLVHDALQIFFNALQLYGAGNRKIPRSKHNCSEPRRSIKSHFGFELANFMKTLKYVGVTGTVEFNNVEPYKGSRTQFKLEIVELSKGEFSKIGYWDTTEKVNYDRELKDPEQQMIEAIQGKTFQIVVKLGEPFCMMRKADESVLLEGNARYEGYVVDLIIRIQQTLKFKFELEVIPDGQYGSMDPVTKKWNGMVKHLLDRKADLAIADLTITYERKTAVDFTMPFMSLGIGILFTKPPKKEANLFSFLDPFTVDVWLYSGLAYISVSLVVFFLSRINNDDWESSHPCNQDPDEVESIWNILNCVWLAMGSIMGQGCDILPK